jgi:hypothetical protein
LFVPESPRIWSDKRLADPRSYGRNFELARDGRRVVAAVPIEDANAEFARNHVIFIENFYSELRRLVPR